MSNTTEQGRGQTALVTGGANGIGWAICQALAARGYRVAIADLDLAAAQERAQTLGPDHLALGVDLTDANAASALPGQAAQALGRLDLVVNNAGMTDTTGKSIATLPEDRFDRLVALNTDVVSVAVAPDLVVTRIAPLKGNEKVIGTKYWQVPTQLASIARAYRTQSPVIDGPVNLIQGGRGYILRLSLIHI